MASQFQPLRFTPADAAAGPPLQRRAGLPPGGPQPPAPQREPGAQGGRGEPAGLAVGGRLAGGRPDAHRRHHDAPAGLDRQAGRVLRARARLPDELRGVVRLRERPLPASRRDARAPLRHAAQSAQRHVAHPRDRGPGRGGLAPPQRPAGLDPQPGVEPGDVRRSPPRQDDVHARGGPRPHARPAAGRGRDAVLPRPDDRRRDRRLRHAGDDRQARGAVPRLGPLPRRHAADAADPVPAGAARGAHREGREPEQHPDGAGRRHPRREHARVLRRAGGGLPPGRGRRVQLAAAAAGAERLRLRLRRLLELGRGDRPRRHCSPRRRRPAPTRPSAPSR